MKKTLLILENDMKVPEFFEKRITRDFDGGVIELTSLKTRSKEEIVAAVMKATHIACQTAFVQGSDDQLIEFVGLLAKMPPKEVYISYHNLVDYLKNALTDEQFHSVKHHKIHDFNFRFEDSVLLDFSEQIGRHQAILDYKVNAQGRPTGMKVKILCCNAVGSAFKTLPIGGVVDVIDNSQADPNSMRGVWVWGNGEPVKLINDLGGPQEYEIVADAGGKEASLTDKIMNSTSTFLPYHDEDGTPVKDLAEELLKDYRVFVDESLARFHSGEYTAMTIATEICDYLGIERRGNRKLIIQLLNK